ncbi:MAG: hypothetical protein MJY83_07085 [Bacteroidales bacterium]|nr:hypothetical protein [Bacteroidales bacterium]
MKLDAGIHTAGAVLAVGAAAFTGCAPEKHPAKKPNVVFILMDDSGYCDFGCYGQTKTETPNIDPWLQTACASPTSTLVRRSPHPLAVGF